MKELLDMRALAASALGVEPHKVNVFLRGDDLIVENAATSRVVVIAKVDENPDRAVCAALLTHATDTVRTRAAAVRSLSEKLDEARWMLDGAESCARTLAARAGMPAEPAVEALPPDAATEALDEIAKLCGCPEWHYPGQVLRDVRNLVANRNDLAERSDRQAARLGELGDVLRAIVDATEGTTASDGVLWTVAGMARRALAEKGGV